MYVGGSAEEKFTAWWGTVGDMPKSEGEATGAPGAGSSRPVKEGSLERGVVSEASSLKRREVRR